MERAKITSKGQVTIPVEVRRSLGLEEGDILAFEVKAGYLTASRQASLREVSDAIRDSTRRHLPVYADDDEAILSAFDDADAAEMGDELFFVRPTTEDLA